MKQSVLLDSGMRRNDGSSTKSEPNEANEPNDPNDLNDLNLVSYKRGPLAAERPDLSEKKLCLDPPVRVF